MYPVSLDITNSVINGLLLDGSGRMEDFLDTCTEDGVEGGVKVYEDGKQLVNDDVQAEVTSSTINYLSVKGDSLVLKADGLTNTEGTALELVDSSALYIKNSRFGDFSVTTKEALDMFATHVVFDGRGLIQGSWESDVTLRSAIITSSKNVWLKWREPVKDGLDGGYFYIETESGRINLDHIKVNYGMLNVHSVYGNVDIVQAFPSDLMSQVLIFSNHYKLDFEAPSSEYYRDLTDLIEYEFEGGSLIENEDAQATYFSFLSGPSSTPFTSDTDNIAPFVKFAKTDACTEYGTLTWRYADNLKIQGVQELASDGTLNLSGFDYISGVSTIYAAGLQSYLNFNISELDSNKLYYVLLEDRTGKEEDLVNKVTEVTNTCKRSSGEVHDPLDTCVAYIIVPTFDLLNGQITSGPTLSLDAQKVYLKDCASSYFSSLKVTNASDVYLGNVVSKDTSVTMKYQDWTVSNYMYGGMRLWISMLSTSKLTVGTDNEDVPVDAHISFAENAKLGLTIGNVKVTSKNYGLEEGSKARTVIPGVDIVPTGETRTIQNDGTYSYFKLDGEKDVSFSFYKDSTGGEVDVTLGNSDWDRSILTITLTKIYSHQDSDIKSGDRIIVDNHRFATEFSSDLNKMYPYNLVSTNNVYVIPTSGKAGYFVTHDADIDGILYKSYASPSVTNGTTVTTHKFNIIEQAQIYLYVPANTSDISIRSAGDNINFILSNLGVYDRIYNSSYLIANVLSANSARASSSFVYDFRGNGSLYTEIGYVGVDLDKISGANVVIDYDNTYDTEKFGDLPGASSAPVVMLKEGTVKDLGIYTRNYKFITECDASEVQNGNSEVKCDVDKIVICKDEKCGIVNYLWGPSSKRFWAGKEFNEDNLNKSLRVVFESKGPTNSDEMRNYGVMGRCPENYEDAPNCPNSPIYGSDLTNLSAISFRGAPSITEEFVKSSNLNNRTLNIQRVQPTYPEDKFEFDDLLRGLTLGILIVVCVIAAVVIAMFVLRFLGKESLNDFRSTQVGVIGPN